VLGRFRVFEEWDSQEAVTEHFATPHFAAFGQDFNEGDLISMDVHRYIDPEIAGSTEGPPLLPCPTRSPWFALLAARLSPDERWSAPRTGKRVFGDDRFELVPLLPREGGCRVMGVVR
jgi:hypothetical protein